MLNDAQITILANDINNSTDPEVIAARDTRNDTLMAEIYNRDSAYWVWRTSLTEEELVSDTSPDGTVWDWTVFIGRSQGERDAFARIFNTDHTINPALAQVRSGLADIFSGPQGADQRTHMLAMGKRLATRGEELFATGTGSSASPGTMDFEGAITIQDIGKALN